MNSPLNDVTALIPNLKEGVFTPLIHKEYTLFQKFLDTPKPSAFGVLIEFVHALCIL